MKFDTLHQTYSRPLKYSKKSNLAICTSRAQQKHTDTAELSVEAFESHLIKTRNLIIRCCESLTHLLNRFLSSLSNRSKALASDNIFRCDCIKTAANALKGTLTNSSSMAHKNARVKFFSALWNKCLQQFGQAIFSFVFVFVFFHSTRQFFNKINIFFHVLIWWSDYSLKN